MEATAIATTTGKAVSARGTKTGRTSSTRSSKAAKPRAAVAKAPSVVPAPAPERQEAASPNWYALLEAALLEPGELSNAFKHFRQYSLTNRWLASTQLRAAGLPLMPINTFKGWLNVNRAVQKGQKASIALIMPVPVKASKMDEEGVEQKKVVFTKFMLRNYWFHMGQTEGEEYVPEPVAADAWSLSSAMGEFSIIEGKFEFSSVSDLRQGYAIGNTVAVSPLATHPDFALLREMARVVLGHTADEPAKSVPADQGVRDLEAEATAYLCAATLSWEGLAESRALLQANLAATGMSRIPDRSVHRAFSAADKLINAGYC